jgi:cytochrome P450
MVRSQDTNSSAKVRSTRVRALMERHCLSSAKQTRNHKKMRAQLNTAFSDKSLREQEQLIAEPIDLFIAQIGEGGDCPQGIDMVKWFNLMTFDIIGSLAFGESFGGLKEGKFHEWIQLVTGSMKQGGLADSLGRFPAIAAVAKTLFPGFINKILEDTHKHEAHTMNLVRRYSPSTSVVFVLQF